MASSCTAVVASYNVCHPYNPQNFAFLPGKGKDFESRVAHIDKTLFDLSNSCNIICLQEIEKSNLNKLNLPANWGRYHVQNILPSQDGIAVLFNTDKYTIRSVRSSGAGASGHGSQVPPLHTGAQAKNKREMLVFLEDKATSKIIEIASAHIVGGPDRLDGDTQLSQLLTYFETAAAAAHIKPDVCIIAGDFNEDILQAPVSKRREILGSIVKGTSVDGGTERDQHGVRNSRHLDYIVAWNPTPNSPAPQVESKSLNAIFAVNDPDLNKSSDHFPVVCNVTIYTQTT